MRQISPAKVASGAIGYRRFEPPTTVLFLRTLTNGSVHIFQRYPSRKTVHDSPIYSNMLDINAVTSHSMGNRRRMY